MSRRHLAVSVLLLAAPLAAQTPRDTVAERAVRLLATDSILLETCRGGTLSPAGTRCTGATAAPRVTYLRRYALRADSILQQLLAGGPLPQPIRPPVAAFRVAETPGLDTLDGRLSTAGSAAIMLYTWHASDPTRPDRTGPVITRGDPGTYQETLTVTDANGLHASVTQSVTIPPRASAYDSIASIRMLTSAPTAAVGDSVVVCGVFTTRSGARGLLLFEADSIRNDTPGVATLRPGSDTACGPLLSAAGITLTAGLAARHARWTVRAP